MRQRVSSQLRFPMCVPCVCTLGVYIHSVCCGCGCVYLRHMYVYILCVSVPRVCVCRVCVCVYPGCMYTVCVFTPVCV